MCFEERIHEAARHEGMMLTEEYRTRAAFVSPSTKRNSNMQKRNRAVKRLLIALAAIVSIYLVRATGLDGGLIDEVFDAAIEAATEPPEIRDD